MDYDNEVTDQIREGLDSIDESVSVSTPDMSRFREMVTLIENKKRIRARNEAILFIIFASIVISFEVYAFNQSIIFFTALQSFAFLTVMITLFVTVKRGHKKVTTA